MVPLDFPENAQQRASVRLQFPPQTFEDQWTLVLVNPGHSLAALHCRPVGRGFTAALPVTGDEARGSASSCQAAWIAGLRWSSWAGPECSSGRPRRALRLGFGDGRPGRMQPSPSRPPRSHRDRLAVAGPGSDLRIDRGDRAASRPSSTRGSGCRCRNASTSLSIPAVSPSSAASSSRKASARYALRS